MKSQAPPESVDPNHYSYAVYADSEMAGAFDRLRFSGPIGTLIAESQRRVLIEFAGEVAGRAVLDVGTGTGRGALILARRGAHVTGLDASPQMLEVARRQARDEGLAIEWLPGDAHSLEFPDGSFEVAISLRVLMHAPLWRRCLGELCRVARRRIVFDYPALGSVAAAQAAWRRLLAATGRPVEAYRVFSERAIARELAACGYRIASTHRQFVLPIALHKAVGSRPFTERSERALRAVGLLRLCGSPVTVAAERIAG